MDTFEHWWKAEGQFVPPMDRIFEPVFRAQFEKIAHAAYEAAAEVTERELQEAFDEGFEHAMEQAEKKGKTECKKLSFPPKKMSHSPSFVSIRRTTANNAWSG